MGACRVRARPGEALVPRVDRDKGNTVDYHASRLLRGEASRRGEDHGRINACFGRGLGRANVPKVEIAGTREASWTRFRAHGT